MNPLDKYKQDRLKLFYKKIDSYDKDGGFIRFIEDYDNDDFDVNLIYDFLSQSLDFQLKLIKLKLIKSLKPKNYEYDEYWEGYNAALSAVQKVLEGGENE